MNRDPQNKVIYDKFCQQNESIPLFLRSWWLDAVCEGNWDVCLSLDKEGGIKGVLPYHLTKHFGSRTIKMPLLTPYLGVWYHYPLGMDKQASRYQFELSVGEELLQQLPSHAYCRIHLHPDVTNWLPFYRAHFQQTTLYTFVLDNRTKKEELFANFQSSLRRKIRQAERLLQIECPDDVASFYHLNELVFSDQRLPVPYTRGIFRNIDEELRIRNCRKIYLARDGQGDIVAGLYIVIDEDRVYYLASGVDRSRAPQGATALLVWQALREMDAGIAHFDFEGSMMKGVANFFAAFGGRIVPYHALTHYSTIWHRWANDIRKRLR